MTGVTTNPSLRRALSANAAFSGASGLTLTLFGAPLASGLLTVAAIWPGLAAGTVLRLLGLGLLAFAAILLMLSRAPSPARRAVMAVIIADFAWVAGSGALLLMAWSRFTTVGIVATLAVALVVGALGVAQLRALSAPA